MKKATLHSSDIAFFAGASLLFAVSWAVPWYTSSVWGSQPASAFEGTVWAAFGPIFITMMLLGPMAQLILFVGALAMSGEEGQSFRILCTGIVLAVLSTFGPYGTIEEYHPNVFAVAGFLILTFCYLTVWFWIKSHRRLTDPRARFGHGCQLLGYLFYLMTSLQMCALLGNPFSGLFHQGFASEDYNPGSWPFLYAMGTRAAFYLAAGFVCSFLGDYYLFQSLVDSPVKKTA